jgi:hypothetical protein
VERFGWAERVGDYRPDADGAVGLDSEVRGKKVGFHRQLDVEVCTVS